MRFLAQGHQIPPYLAYPRFLLNIELTETVKLIYIILLDRARISIKNAGWTDAQGNVFLYYTIQALADTIHKSEMTVNAFGDDYEDNFDKFSLILLNTLQFPLMIISEYHVY